MNFSNNEIPFDELPKYEDIPLNSLPKNALKVDLISTIIAFCVIGAVIIISGIIWKNITPYNWYVLAIVSAIFLLSGIMSIIGFKYRGIAVREKDIIYKDGLLFRSTTILPFDKVQHCEIIEGPLDRKYGISTLKIYTAGGSASDLSIDGLNNKEAIAIKNFIIKKTNLDEEE